MKSKSNQQLGLALLSTMIIVTFMLLSVFTMATINLKESKQTVVYEESTKAFQAAQGGLEDGLLWLKNNYNNASATWPSTYNNNINGISYSGLVSRSASTSGNWTAADGSSGFDNISYAVGADQSYFFYRMYGANNKPNVVWGSSETSTDSKTRHYTKLYNNGTSDVWSNIRNSPGIETIVTNSNNDFDLDIEGNLHFVWLESYTVKSRTYSRVCYQRWNPNYNNGDGTFGTWTKADRITTGYDRVIEGYDLTRSPHIKVDKNLNVHITLAMDIDTRSSSTNWDPIYVKWNEATKSWGKANGALGFNNLNLDAGGMEVEDGYHGVNIYLDNSNLPHILTKWWTVVPTDQGLYYTRWDPTYNGGAGGWVKGNGTSGCEVISGVSNLDGDMSSELWDRAQQLIIFDKDDPTNKPYVIWMDGWRDFYARNINIYITKYNGGWKALDNSSGYNTIDFDGTNNTEDSAPRPLIINGVFHIAWYISSNFGDTGRIAYSKWDNEDNRWEKANGESGFECVNCGTTYTSVAHPYIAIDPNDPNQYPHLIFYYPWDGTSTTATDLYYAKWNGSSWQFENVTSSLKKSDGTDSRSTSPIMRFDSSSVLHLTWRDNGGSAPGGGAKLHVYDLFYSRRSGSGVTSYTYTIEITAESNGVKQKIKATAEIVSGSVVIKSWQEVAPQ